MSYKSSETLNFTNRISQINFQKIFDTGTADLFKSKYVAPDAWLFKMLPVYF